MTIADFTAAVESAVQIGPVRQKSLIDDAPWMRPEERQYVADQVTGAVEQIKTKNEQIALQLDKIEDALSSYSKEELPKLVKEKESSELQEDEQAADKLLEDL